MSAARGTFGDAAERVMLRNSMPPSHARLARAIEGWRKLPRATRAHLTEYLEDDIKERRESEDCTPSDEWLKSNVAALELLRAVAGWKP